VLTSNCGNRGRRQNPTEESDNAKQVLISVLIGQAQSALTVPKSPYWRLRIYPLWFPGWLFEDLIEGGGHSQCRFCQLQLNDRERELALELTAVVIVPMRQVEQGTSNIIVSPEGTLFRGFLQILVG
jgi:hypothetical protein